MSMTIRFVRDNDDAYRVIVVPAVGQHSQTLGWIKKYYVRSNVNETGDRRFRAVILGSSVRLDFESLATAKNFFRHYAE